MKKAIKYYRIIWLRYDLPAGLSVFFVALPLCLGIALASGAPLYAGIVSGIIGGVIVGAISGSQLAVSGPAAGLTTIVAASIISLGDYKLFLLAVIIAGAFQLLLGIFKLGVIGNYFPSAVIKGMLAAIGIILVAGQIPIAIGYDHPDFWSSGFLKILSGDPSSEKIYNLHSSNTQGVIFIAAISLAILIVFNLFSFFRRLKLIPASLIVVVAGIVINTFFIQLAPQYALNQSQLVNIPNDIFTSISFPDFRKFFSNPSIWKDGITIGIVATLETLLCIEAVDKLDKRNRITPMNQELVAQGIGNILCGALGAIPLTAVVVRGAANVDAGGRTKLSAITHGIFLLLAVLFIPFLLNRIPFASLSAILIIVGYNLSKPKLYRSMWRLGWDQFLPFIITIIAILMTDLLIGVCTGLLISAYFIIRNNFKAEYNITKTVIEGIETDYIKLNTDVTFLNKVSLKKALDEIPENSRITIDGSESNFIDYDILEIISEFENKAKNKNIDLLLIDIDKVNIDAIH